MTLTFVYHRTHVNASLLVLSFADKFFHYLKALKKILAFVFLVLVASTTHAPNAWAQTPCEKAFQKYYKNYLKPASTHYAVATTGGRSLASTSTACAISSGQVSKRASMKEAIKTCKLEQRSTGYFGACTVIKSR